MPSLLGFGSYNLEMLKNIFTLTDSDLQKNILVYGAGATTTPLANICFADTLYQYSLNEIEKMIQAKAQSLIIDFEKRPQEYNLDSFSSPASAIHLFNHNAEAFLKAFIAPSSHKQFTYSPFPNLPFKPMSTDILLCLDTVFSDQNLSSDQIFDNINQIAHLAHDIRIFPLCTESGQISTSLAEIMLKLQENRFGIELKQSKFSFQTHANAYLKLWPLTCEI